MTKRGKSFVNPSDPAFIYEHTFQWMCMELTLEPFTFTQKKIINIETAFMQCFIVALALGDDEICCFKQFPCFLADMWKPGAADIIAIADDSGNLCKPDLLGIFPLSHR